MLFNKEASPLKLEVYLLKIKILIYIFYDIYGLVFVPELALTLVRI